MGLRAAPTRSPSYTRPHFTGRPSRIPLIGIDTESGQGTCATPRWSPPGSTCAWRSFSTVLEARACAPRSRPRPVSRPGGTTLDISKTTEPRSDQLNFDDVAVAPLTITVTEVKAGPPDQPVHLHSAEYPGRPYKPGKSMRRVLVAAWGKDGSEYVGRRIMLFGDPTIRFGKDEVGGIRISHLSHIDKALTIPLTITRGKRAPFVVEPLTPDPAITAAIETLEQASSLPALKTAWDLAGTRGVQSHPDVVAVKERRKQELGES